MNFSPEYVRVGPGQKEENGPTPIRGVGPFSLSILLPKERPRPYGLAPFPQVKRLKRIGLLEHPRVLRGTFRFRFRAPEVRLAFPSGVAPGHGLQIALSKQPPERELASLAVGRASAF